jgi:hypothetical protein
MTTTSDAKAMRAVVDADPLNWQARLALADAHGEAGDADAELRQRRTADLLRRGGFDWDGAGSSVPRIMKYLGYRRRLVRIRFATRVPLEGTYWDGGSRSVYHTFELDTGCWMACPSYSPPQFGGPKETPTVEVGGGKVVVESGTFCGKTTTLYIHVHPDDLPRLMGWKS